MINVNQITSQLAKLPDQALQQFAQMHKDDPYTLALTVAESNRRKELRSASQGQQAQQAQPQPKVADAAIAEMGQQTPPQQAPQPQAGGVSALPTGSMNFAPGGLVSFAIGGLTPDEEAEYKKLVPLYQRVQQPWGGELPWSDEADASSAVGERVIPRFQELQQKVAAAHDTAAAGRKSQMEQAAAQHQQALQQGLAQQYGVNLPPQQGAKPATSGAATAGGPPYSLRVPYDRGSVSPEYTRPPLAGATPSLAPSAAPATQAPPMPSAGLSALADLDKQQAAADKRLEAHYNELANNHDPAYANWEKMRAEDEAGDAKRRSQGIGMALIAAGAATAATAGPLGVALAHGAAAGLPQYQKTLDALEKSDAERRKMQMLVEETRRAQKEGRTKDLIALDEKRQEAADKFGMLKTELQARIAMNREGIESRMTMSREQNQTALSVAEAQTSGREAAARARTPTTPQETALVNRLKELDKYINGVRALGAASPEMAQQLEAAAQERRTLESNLSMLYNARTGAAGQGAGTIGSFSLRGGYSPAAQ